MVQFAPNQTIETAEPTITVDAGLPLGQHRFQLVVIDAAGNRSRPAVAIVEIQRAVPIAPDPVATPVSPIDPLAVTPTRLAPAPSVTPFVSPMPSPVVSPTPAPAPVASPTPSVSGLASARPTGTPSAPATSAIRTGPATPIVPHALPESAGAPTSAEPPRKPRSPAKKPKRSPKKPRPPRKEK
jgi:hypothetical protein